MFSGGSKENIGKNRVKRLCQRVINLNEPETQLKITSTILMNMRSGEIKDATLTRSKLNLVIVNATNDSIIWRQIILVKSRRRKSLNTLTSLLVFVLYSNQRDIRD